MTPEDAVATTDRDRGLSDARVSDARPFDARVSDARLSDARTPTAGSTNYVQNTTLPQASSLRK